MIFGSNKTSKRDPKCSWKLPWRPSRPTARLAAPRPPPDGEGAALVVGGIGGGGSESRWSSYSGAGLGSTTNHNLGWGAIKKGHWLFTTPWETHWSMHYAPWPLGEGALRVPSESTGVVAIPLAPRVSRTSH